MDEQKARQGEIAELIVKKKLEDLPPGYSVIANVDIAAEGKSSELDTVVVTPTGVIVVLEVKAGDLIADESGHVVRDYGAGGQKDIVKQLNRQGGNCQESFGSSCEESNYSLVSRFTNRKTGWIRNRY